MTAAPAPIRRAVFTVANPDAQPSQAWIHCVARLLLAHADRQIAAERDSGQADKGQEQEVGNQE